MLLSLKSLLFYLTLWVSLTSAQILTPPPPCPCLRPGGSGPLTWARGVAQAGRVGGGGSREEAGGSAAGVGGWGGRGQSGGWRGGRGGEAWGVGRQGSGWGEAGGGEASVGGWGGLMQCGRWGRVAGGDNAGAGSRARPPPSPGTLAAHALWTPGPAWAQMPGDSCARPRGSHLAPPAHVGTAPGAGGGSSACHLPCHPRGAAGTRPLQMRRAQGPGAPPRRRARVRPGPRHLTPPPPIRPHPARAICRPWSRARPRGRDLGASPPPPQVRGPPPPGEVAAPLSALGDAPGPGQGTGEGKEQRGALSWPPVEPEERSHLAPRPQK